MAYLSQYTLSLVDARAMRMIDTYSLHRVVYDLFPLQREDRQQHSGILFVDKGGDARPRCILILSDRSPLEPQYGKIKTAPMPEFYLDAKSYRFEIVINPVCRENSTGKLLAIRGREAIAEWFCAKAPNWGFSVREDSLLIVDTKVDRFVKGGHQVTLNKAHITGFLDVLDSTLFVSSVLQGIGRAKSFGCGLLQIVPAL
ncbi:MAG: type I-E CRISPR-associated protein Cas6/Cse3/CasE [Pseudomonadota bacterium]